MPDCPLRLEALPPNLRKHADPASSMPIREMAAKGLVPMGPRDLVTALFMLSFDAEPALADQARETAAGLPDRILGGVLRDGELDPGTLDFLATVLSGRESCLEGLCLNPTTSDETIARIASHCSERICSVIAQNQLRLLRHEPLLRGLLGNPLALKSTLDGVADFAVRFGVELTDLPALDEARLRVFGPEALTPAEPTPSAVDVVREFGVEADGASALEEGRRLTFSQRVRSMTVAQRVKLAILGNKEARGVLLRDSNKLVAMAAIQSPRITEVEVLAVATSRTAPEELLRWIYGHREWLKSYQLKMALVKNPKVPLPTALRFLPLLRDSDVRELSRNKNVPAGVQNQARAMVLKKEAPKRSPH